ncbi:hypothetical protein M422DRAFT_276738 [Sphaerobolus stellatus SS14]|uniref:Uncharacterized protein n=1 Tax=Sphaerobolus stellatus (strain SS14) TaxID=990650 RepID=A0A0C9TLN3_SPHS4|nr:hypothetical protein M422DRAFT_276738 [Sphaerobolus stellatus SS14]
MAARIQPGNAPPGLAPRPTRRTSGTPVPMDIVDPVSILADKGITQKNRTDIGALAGVIESFGNFKKSDGKLGTTSAATANALQAMAILLREAEQQLKSINTSITKEDLQAAVTEIKASMSTSLVQPSTTYAQALSGPRPAINDPRAMLKTEIKDKQILVSTRNVAPSSDLVNLSTRNLSERFNDIITTFFAQPQQSAYSMTKPIRGITRSNAGNLILTFRNIAETENTRIYANE